MTKIAPQPVSATTPSTSVAPTPQTPPVVGKPPIIPKNNVVKFVNPPPLTISGAGAASPLARGLAFVRNVGPGAAAIGLKALAFLSPLALGGSEARRPGYNAFALGAGGYQGNYKDPQEVRAWQTQMRTEFANLTDAQRALFAEVEEDVFGQPNRGPLTQTQKETLEEAYREITVGTLTPDAPLERDSNHDQLRPDIPPELPSGSPPPRLDYADLDTPPLGPEIPLEWKTLPAREGSKVKPPPLQIDPTVPAEVDRASTARVDLDRTGTIVDAPVPTDATVEAADEINLTSPSDDDETFRSTDIRASVTGASNEVDPEQPSPQERFRNLAASLGLSAEDAEYILSLLPPANTVSEQDRLLHVDVAVDVLHGIALHQRSPRDTPAEELRVWRSFVELAQALDVPPLALAIALNESLSGEDPAMVDYHDIDTYRHWNIADMARYEFPTVPLAKMVGIVANTAPTTGADKDVDVETLARRESVKEPFRDLNRFTEAEVREWALEVADFSKHNDLDAASFARELAEALRLPKMPD